MPARTDFASWPLKLGRVRRIPMRALEEFIAERLNETGGDAA